MTLYNEIVGFLLQHNHYTINIMYTGHMDEPPKYYFRLQVNGSRLMLIIKDETAEKESTSEIIKKIDENLRSEIWMEDHILEI